MGIFYDYKQSPIYGIRHLTYSPQVDGWFPLHEFTDDWKDQIGEYLNQAIIQSNDRFELLIPASTTIEHNNHHIKIWVEINLIDLKALLN